MTGLTRRPGKVDPITLEVIAHRLDSIVREMTHVTLRSARSPVIHTGRDFSCGIFDLRADMLAIGTSIPLHIFPMVWQLKKTRDRFQGDIEPGDIFIGNDPHDGGTHLNDVLIFLPIFSADEHIGYACNRAHWYDIGGMTAGSISGFAREIYQEGLRIPPIRLGRGGKPDRDLLEMIGRNTRFPSDAVGDLHAQLASCKLAVDRVQELTGKYGKGTVLDAWDDLLAASERRMRARIAQLPDTTVTHEGYLDNDGVTDDHIRIRATVSVKADQLVVDYRGSAPQSQGCINVTKALAIGFAFIGVKSAIDPSGPINSGCFRPIEVLVPEGSLLDAKPPAAAGGMAEVGQAAVITMIALGKLVPHQVSAEEGVSANHQNFSGHDERHSSLNRFIYYDAISAGGGARSHKDGLDFVRNIRSGNFTMMSVEVLERLYPILFLRQAFRRDSGGAGRFRGGVGIERAYRSLGVGVLSVLSDHAIISPGGLEGGHRGAPTRWDVISQDGERLPISRRFRSKGAIAVGKGDIVQCLTSGGGGWGDPLERDPAAVLADVLDGFVSADEARLSYGVVIDLDRAVVDDTLTTARRKQAARLKCTLAAHIGDRPVFQNGVRNVLAGPLVEKVGFVDGQIVEISAPKGFSPLLARLAIRARIPREGVVIDREAWSELGLSPDDTVTCRHVADAIGTVTAQQRELVPVV